MSTLNNTDLFIVERSGVNYSVDAASVAAFAGSGGISAATLAQAAAGTLNTVYSSPETAVPKDSSGMAGAAILPGSAAAYAGTPAAGMLRYNNSAPPAYLEYYNGSAWVPLATVSATQTFGLGLNVTGNLVKVGIPVLAAAPTVGAGATQAVTGSVWFDSTNGLLRTYDGTNWLATEPANWQPAAATPATRLDGTANQAGDSYYNTASTQTLYYNGTDWAPSDERRPVIVSAAYTAKANDYVVVDTATQTVTLPASPLPGTCVTVVVAGTFLDTVVARNGSNIMSLAQDITLDKQYAAMQFTYTDATNGWRLN